MPNAFTDYLFLASMMLPPIALAVGFLDLISPSGLARSERRHPLGAKAH